MVDRTGMGIILMLSASSAPSRVPHVVCPVSLEFHSGGLSSGCQHSKRSTHLLHGQKTVEFDQIMEIAEQYRNWDKADVCRIP